MYNSDNPMINPEEITAKETAVFSRDTSPEAINHLENWFESMWKIADEVFPQKTRSGEESNS